MPIKIHNILFQFSELLHQKSLKRFPFFFTKNLVELGQLLQNTQILSQRLYMLDTELNALSINSQMRK